MMVKNKPHVISYEPTAMQASGEKIPSQSSLYRKR